MGVLHLCAVLAAPLLIWNSPVIDNRLLVLWCIGQVVLAGAAFTTALLVHRGRLETYKQLTQFRSLATALAFGALPWLGRDIAGTAPSKHILMIAAIAVTSIAASNSAHITGDRPFFWRFTVVVAISYSIAYGVSGEFALALLTVLWCISIAAVTNVGHHAVLELLQLRRESEESARHDDLTGLLSRSAFFESLASAGRHKPRGNQGNASLLVLFDLDGFKAINDSFGHAVGDKVLQVVAARLPRNLPAGAEIGRVGGDEFAVVLAGQRTPTGMTVDRTLRALAEPIHVDDLELYIAASAGWTVVDREFSTAELMAQADAAMYQSKRSTVDASTGFNAELREELDRSLDLRRRFRSALMKSEIEFHSQPLVRLSDRYPVAVELLARWPQPDESAIPPEEFTRVAGETGLAVELDRHALNAAAQLLDTWQSDGLLQTLVVKVNISPVHLRNDQLVESVRELVPRRHWRRLGLEFVESQLITTASRNRSQLRTLLDMGITLSIDDFGVGYSSLTYLRSLPVSELKIDRSFVTAIDSDPVNQALMRAIVDVAATLGLPTVAEGVETEEEFEAARRLGLSTCQGFLTGRPLPLDDTDSVLRDLQQQSLDSTSQA